MIEMGASSIQKMRMLRSRTDDPMKIQKMRMRARTDDPMKVQ